MLILGIKNTATQAVPTDSVISLGTVYRKFCKKNSCGVPAFSRTSEDVSLNHKGVYRVTATFVASGSVAGDVTVQLLLNGTPVEGALSTETITTADTEFRTLVIDYYVLVDESCILGTETTVSETVSFVNTGVDATFTNVVTNIEKVV